MPAIAIDIPFAGGALPGLLDHPADARWIYVLAHGAGAGMRHAFLGEISAALAARGIATLRWELPYMAAGRKRPDPPAVAEDAVRAAVARARTIGASVRVAAGGKSFGGRMTSQAAAHGLALDAIVFLGFPLHPAKQPATTRAAHLRDVAPPMLFVQGTRDALAEPELLRPIIASLPRATLIEIDGADHGFAVPARRRGDDVIGEIASHVAGWLGSLPST
jgi:predicted alpha/beta-hydrolase family hydrolase